MAMRPKAFDPAARTSAPHWEAVKAKSAQLIGTPSGPRFFLPMAVSLRRVLHPADTSLEVRLAVATETGEEHLPVRATARPLRGISPRSDLRTTTATGLSGSRLKGS